MLKLNNTQQQRWLALGLLLGIIISVGAFIIVPWLNNLSEINDKIDEQVFRIKRYQRVIASREEVLMDVEQGRKEINALGYFNTQASFSLATAELQNSIKAMAVDAGGELSSSQVLPNKEQDGLTRIAVKVRLTGDMEMLRSLLYQIEIKKPLLIIENITVVPAPKKRNRKTRKAELTGNIVVTLEVSSYMRKQV
ncbi:MAG: type II secretion system protein M [Candidatus Methanofishera endochildressiae]|uniref:Type II secretion system protein M n=1 Tax=Candidatus Methanofishera endochildressiae TaxID=2738884 RepID=A0A7Z0SE57_9GAMM|nr:type II secretion system protein M [Candidatus Methanofishera endochildressiae]